MRLPTPPRVKSSIIVTSGSDAFTSDESELAFFFIVFIFG